MEQIQFNYSIKNIPIPGRQDYRIQLINSIEKFVRNLRWKTYFFLNPPQKELSKENFGFNSTKPAPSVPELKDLEDKLIDLTRNIKFNYREHSNFQRDLAKDKETIESESRMFIAADKTTNYYKVEKDKHEELLVKHITKDYKKSNNKAVDDITKADKKIATELELDDRIYSTSKKQAFITLKDHKQNFNNNPTCRLLHPTKSEIGRISKEKLSKIVNIVREKTKFNQWKNSASVIKWFSNINNKKKCPSFCLIYVTFIHP